jgi:hypothetical protein
MKTYIDDKGYLSVRVLTCAQLANTFQEDASLYPTGHGCAAQICEAYSEIVRSLENFPELATLRMHFSAQLSDAR